MKSSLALHGAVLALVVFGSSAILYARGVRFNLPGIDRGYSPVQPIAFSHRLHAGELEMRCLYCHSGAEKSRHAGVPSVSVCMNCHRYVQSAHQTNAAPLDAAALDGAGAKHAPPVSPELQKLYTAIGYDPAMHAYVSDAETYPIEWLKVHDLPDFVAFDHSRHVKAEVACQTCHGPVETMDRVVQVGELSMGWCLDCHRAVNKGKVPELRGRAPSTDCGACHY